MAVGLETGTDAAQLIAPAERAGVVGLKPTVGLVSTEGILPVATTQDAPGPITRTVGDAALQLQATAEGPEVGDYVASAGTTDLTDKRIAVLNTTTGPYGTAVSILQGLGATTAVRTIGTPSPNPASIVQREFKRDLEAYLAGTTGPGPKTLQGIIDYNIANPVEGLKYQQRGLEAANAVDLSDPAVAETYESDKEQGIASTRALIDAILTNGTPADPSDDFDAIMVNRGSNLLGFAARAGYPMLTMTVGEGTGNEGRNPIGVTFVGTAFSEEKLIGVAAALEQAPDSYVRRAPSVTNPSMWRCVPGSAFFTMERCHPGDRMYKGLSSTSLTPALPAIPGAIPATPAKPVTKAPKK
jgi:Asp-tRNA(Asn)/Glu-tRNA(Gln) amidotransferase A subunit family amidase